MDRKKFKYGIIVAGFIILITAFNIWMNNFYFSSFLNIFISILLIIYCCLNIKRRLALLFFTLTLDLFLIFRPVLDILTGFKQFLTFHYLFVTAQKANVMIMLTMVFIFGGHFLYEQKLSQTEKKATKPYPTEAQRKIMDSLITVLLSISLISFVITTLEKIKFRQNNSYTALYASFKTELPFLIVGFSAITAILLIFKIFSSNNKKMSYGFLALYTGITGFLMLTGARANFSKAILFAMLIILSKEKIPKLTKSQKNITITIMILLISTLIGVLQYTENARSQEKRRGDFIAPVQFIYDQSISYMSLTRGQELKLLPAYKDKTYTFGPFLDQFGAAKSLKPYTKEFVEQGDSFAADIAYYLYKDNAFKGYGLGSSYLIEVFSDFGYLGIIIYSSLLGLLLGSLSNISWVNLVIDAVKLRILLEIFYIPRAPATQFLVNLFVPQFYLPLFGLIIFAYLVSGVITRRRIS